MSSLTVSLHDGDADVVLSNSIPSASVHLVVTSPPYDKLRKYAGKTWNFEQTALELYRVLCQGGVVCWVVNDSVKNGSESLTSCKQKIFFVETCGFKVLDTMIYGKTNFSNPEKVRYHQMFEYVIVLSKGRPRTWHPIKDKKNVCAGKPGSLGKNTYTQVDGSKKTRARKVNTEFGMRGNIWIGKTRGQEEMCKKLPYTAMMPRWLARDLIRSWSNPGDTVLDPFIGSGTTAEEALKLKRHVIGIDNSKVAIDHVTRQLAHAL